MTDGSGEKSNPVSRRRYERERQARAEAEKLLEQRSREVWEANEELKNQAAQLEAMVAARTKDLEQAKEAAERANEAKSSFLAMISHDIRTPLNGVLGMADALADGTLNRHQDEMVRLIQSSGNALLGLLNDVLDLTKIEARQIEVETVDFDLHDLLTQVHDLYELQARNSDLKLDLQLHVATGTMVAGDPTRLRQVLGNLLSNAIKFTEVGGVESRISMEGGRLTCAVADTGPGVPADKQHRLFRAFSQAEVSVTRKFGGSGLGLAISREICRLLGGDLVYSDRPGGGAVFTATIDLAEAEGVVEEDTPDQVDPLEYLKIRQPRILAAEDNLTNQKVLTLMLRKMGLEVTIVEDGAKAVEIFCDDPFDIILMDVNMPVMNGLEAAAIIRVAELAYQWPRAPIIALTANAMTHQVTDFLRQGVDAHVPKPVRRAELAHSMASLLQEAERRGPEPSNLNLFFG